MPREERNCEPRFCINVDFHKSSKARRMSQSDANLKMLQEADEIQDKTAESVNRIKQTVAQSEEVGTATLEELRRQAAQIVSCLLT